MQRLGEVADAEDAGQDVIARAAEEGPTANQLQRLAALARQEVDRQRWWRERHGAEAAGLVLAVAADDPAEQALHRVALDTALRKLTPPERRAVAAWCQGLSLSEAAHRCNTTVSVFAGRLRKARQLLRAMGVGLGGVLGGLLRRLRSQTQRSVPRTTLALRVGLDRLFAPSAPPGLAAEAVVATSVVVAVLLATTSAPFAQGLAGSPRGPAGPLTPVQALEATATPDAPPAGTNDVLPPFRPHPVGTLHVIRPGGAQESVDDAQLVSASAAPHYERTHTIVGLGTGRTCGCPVLFRTTDSGATWHASRYGPPAEPDQTIVLPPQYPDDPRVFIGTDATARHVDYMTPAFDEPITALPLPPGQLTVSAGFDNGDPRVFVATAIGVMTYDMRTGAINAMTTQVGQGIPALLATPYGDAEIALLVLAFSPVIGAPSTISSTPPIMWCMRDRSCHVVGIDPLPESTQTFLALSPNFPRDHTLVVASAGRAMLSHDGGASFQPMPDVPRGMAIDSAIIMSTDLWITTSNDHSDAFRVLRMAPSGSAWTDVTEHDPALADRGQLVAIGEHGVLDLVLTLALRCTTDGGTSWRASCTG